MPDAPNSSQVWAVLLAAGGATRFGANKLLADFRGQPLARHAVRLATEVCGNRSILVTGHEWQAVTAACRPCPGFFIVNDAYTEGLGTSLALGIRTVQHAAGAVIVLLADQPLVTASHLRALIERWSGDDREIVASAYANTAGVPALFAAGCFDQLCSLQGDSGAQGLLQDAGCSLQTIEFADAATDIDTPDDLLRIENNVRS